MSVRERVERVRGRISAACERAGRAESDVTLVAVAKTFPADAVVEALEAGVTDVGENRAQELKQKAAVIGGRARWHFVGPLQTNKVRHVVGTVALIHSVDRFGVAEAISRRARSLGIVQEVLVEVNVAGEATKAGVDPVRAAALAHDVAGQEGLSLVGVMGIPPHAPDPEASRPHFEELRRIRDEIAAEIPGARHLSMGMSHDLETAIEEGATLVRVGTAIFGPRNRG